MHCCTQCPQPCSRPLLTHASPETPGHSQASLGQPLVGSLLLSPGSWRTQGSDFAFQKSILQACLSSGNPMVLLMTTSSKKAYAIPKSAAPRAPAPVKFTVDLYLHRRPSNTVLSQSLVGSLGQISKVCLSPLSISDGNEV